MKKLSFAMENYLEAIYELSGGGAGARVSDIARRLDVTKASTNNAMTSLAEKGLVTNEKYGEIFLTSKGLELAKSTSKKHRVIRKYFIEVLKIDSKVADDDACAIEHVISNISVAAMQKYLRDHQK